MNATIASLHAYPVKSARALDLKSAVLTERGLPFDREWLLIDVRGRFQTQRELPQLATLAATVMGRQLQLQIGELRYWLPITATGPRRAVKVWSSDCLGIDCGDAVAQWLSAGLQHELRLLHFDPAQPRASDPGWSAGMRALNAFSDGFPILVASSSALADLNTRLAEPLPMNRFRPNIVIDGLEPWTEDRVDELVGDGVRLKLVKPCTRCVIPTTDQSTGVRGSDEVMKVLRSFRFDAALHGVTFAYNTVIVAGVGRYLSIGETLEIVWKTAS